MKRTLKVAGACAAYTTSGSVVLRLAGSGCGDALSSQTPAAMPQSVYPARLGGFQDPLLHGQPHMAGLPRSGSAGVRMGAAPPGQAGAHTSQVGPEKP